MPHICLSRVCHYITEHLRELQASGAMFSEPMAYRKPRNTVQVVYARRQYDILSEGEARKYLEQLQAGHVGMFVP
jgi:hypothetical protein